MSQLEQIVMDNRLSDSKHNFLTTKFLSGSLVGLRGLGKLNAPSNKDFLGSDDAHVDLLSYISGLNVFSLT